MISSVTQDFLKVLTIGLIGGYQGILVAYALIGAYALMISDEFLKYYFASLFFMIGLIYLYQSCKKRQIQMELENGFAPPMEKKRRVPPPAQRQLPAGRPNREKMEMDRFLIGGREEQPDGYIKGSGENVNAQFFKRQPLITETAALYQ